ncbi:hypothetical protein GCM10007160_35390 [Litchfieldella qijiaojingensis]|uniref:Oxidoreductase n=1 Tax=Litchfieldella qijiaojingensis TaxID=980347 RepID=A0ABQ2Z8E2_9GAMM|nr:oxidoreductase [Halomonas qijiaojingensis]GGY04658.1 hypothetical protein GCM10007160_35390 [Halomonas qijiaojingensis]
MPKRSFLVSLLTLVMPMLLAPPAMAEHLPPPQGKVILTVSGDIEYTNVGDEAQFDYDMLMSMSPYALKTSTPWTEGSSLFEGPLGREVMAAVGARGDMMRIKALNNFVADVPLSDFYDYDVILALKRDGVPMEVRDFGPIFVLYPFDDHPQQLLNETIRFRSVWQVASIHVYE